MRLLHTTNYTLHEFYGEDIPFYAILSHRWESEEITIEDLKFGIPKLRLGYGKIMGCCRRARADGWTWVVSLSSIFLKLNEMSGYLEKYKLSGEKMRAGAENAMKIKRC